MRKITETHTGKIVSDTDLGIEYLYMLVTMGKKTTLKQTFLDTQNVLRKLNTNLLTSQTNLSLQYPVRKAAL